MPNYYGNVGILPRQAREQLNQEINEEVSFVIDTYDPIDDNSVELSEEQPESGRIKFLLPSEETEAEPHEFRYNHTGYEGYNPRNIVDGHSYNDTIHLSSDIALIDHRAILFSIPAEYLYTFRSEIIQKIKEILHPDTREVQQLEQTIKGCDTIEEKEKEEAKREINRLKEVIESLQEEVEHKRRTFEESLRSLHENTAKLDNANDPEEVAQKRREKLESLENMIGVRYQQFMYQNSKIIGITNPITIEHDGHTYPMGTYKVIVGKLDVRIQLTGDFQPEVEFTHPSIIRQDPVLGSYREAADEMHANENWQGIFTLIHEFLEDDEPQHIPLEKWGCQCCYEDIPQIEE